MIELFKAKDGPPSDGYGIIAADDGYYIKKTNPIFEAIAKTTKVSGLGDMEETFRLTASKIPYAVILKALDFFRVVYKKHSAEAAVLLLYQDGEWDLSAPEQEVGGASVDYQVRPVDKEGKLLVGSIHSHPNFGASFSGIDDKDDKYFDGIHIVLGNVDKDIPDIVVSAAVNDSRIELKPEDVIEGWPSPPVTEDDHPWLGQVKKKTYTAAASALDNPWGGKFDSNPRIYDNYLDSIPAESAKDDIAEVGRDVPPWTIDDLKEELRDLEYHERGKVYAWFKKLVTLGIDEEPDPVEVYQAKSELW